MTSNRDGSLFARIARRYATFTIFIVALTLLMLFVPSISTSSTSATGPATGSSGLLPGMTPPAPPGTPGLTVGGVQCGPGVRQVPWSVYAPLCVPKWSGNNGGATSPGVTGSDITITYREASTPELTALYSLIPQDVVGTNQEAEDSLNAFIKVMNSSFELYGRHVVLKTFQGQGDFVNELTGTGQTQAQADAVNVQSIGAFADMSLVDTSQVYVDDLAQEHIISFPQFLQANSFFASNKPYMYSQGPNCTKSGQGIADTVSAQMAGMPAIFSGDADLQAKKRTFGIIYQDNPYGKECAQELQDDLASKGVTVAKVGAYQFNLSSMVSQLSAVLSQFKTAGVTTLIFASSDPVSPGLLMGQAEPENYHPEWILEPYFAGGNVDADAIGRIFNQDQMSHTMAPGIVAGPAQSLEDSKVFHMGASPGQQPLPTYSLAFAYAPLLMFFSALQAAGPNLNPQTFANAIHGLPASTGSGMFGKWQYTADTYDPAASYQIMWWNPTAVSNQDGKLGAFVACNGGQEYLYSDRGKGLHTGAQLSCFGRS